MLLDLSSLAQTGSLLTPTQPHGHRFWHFPSVMQTPFTQLCRHLSPSCSTTVLMLHSLPALTACTWLCVKYWRALQHNGKRQGSTKRDLFNLQFHPGKTTGKGLTRFCLAQCFFKHRCWWGLTQEDTYLKKPKLLCIWRWWCDLSSFLRGLISWSQASTPTHEAHP